MSMKAYIEGKNGWIELCFKGIIDVGWLWKIKTKLILDLSIIQHTSNKKNKFWILIFFLPCTSLSIHVFFHTIQSSGRKSVIMSSSLLTTLLANYWQEDKEKIFHMHVFYC